MISINQPAPDFELNDLNGLPHRLERQRGQVVLINFWSAECPWSEQADQEIKGYLETSGAEIVWWSIAANTNEPLELLRHTAKSRQLPLLLMDGRGAVVRMYEAQTTPHVFLVDPQGILRYRGAVNDRTFRQRIPQRFYLRDAVDALLQNELPSLAETTPYGCTIVQFE